MSFVPMRVSVCTVVILLMFFYHMGKADDGQSLDELCKHLRDVAEKPRKGRFGRKVQTYIHH